MFETVAKDHAAEGTARLASLLRGHRMITRGSVNASLSLIAANQSQYFLEIELVHQFL